MNHWLRNSIVVSRWDVRSDSDTYQRCMIIFMSTVERARTLMLLLSRTTRLDGRNGHNVD